MAVAAVPVRARALAAPAPAQVVVDNLLMFSLVQNTKLNINIYKVNYA